jgi:2-methylcitrate dehydratase PrpD
MITESRLTAQLAEFACGLRYRALPPAAVHEVKRALLDFLGVSFLGANHKTVNILLAYLAQVRGKKALTAKRDMTVLGRAERLDPVSAAWVNGTMGHVYDFDDVHSAAGIHPGIVIAPPSLAAGEWAKASGRKLITAMAAGYEVAGRIGMATQLTHYEPGWHSTGTVGTLGAAAAAINALGLDAEQGNFALGVAASEAAGLRVSFGSMMKPLHAGNAAANGLRAAFLTSLGLTGPATGLEGARGFLEVACGEVDQHSIVEGLGRDYCFVRKGYKLYSCGGVVHPALDAAIELRPQLQNAFGRIQKIHTVVHPQVLEQMRLREPTTGMQSKFSPYHAIAVTLLDGAALPAQFTDERALAPDVTALRQKVTVESDAGVRKDETRMTVTFDDGKILASHIEHARGYSPDNPPSDAELQAKFDALAVPCLGEQQSRELSGRVWALEDEKNVRHLLALCTPVKSA